MCRVGKVLFSWYRSVVRVPLGGGDGRGRVRAVGGRGARHAAPAAARLPRARRARRQGLLPGTVLDIRLPVVVFEYF